MFSTLTSTLFNLVTWASVWPTSRSRSKPRPKLQEQPRRSHRIRWSRLVSAARTSKQATLISALNRVWASQPTQNTSLRLKCPKTLSKNWFLIPCNKKKGFPDQTSHWEPTISIKTCTTFSPQPRLCKSHFKNTGTKETLLKTYLNQNNCWKMDASQA